MSKHNSVTHGCFDSFSGPAALLPKNLRTPAGVLSALQRNPRVSTWDMSEMPWLRGCIDALKASGQITEDKDEPYPWHLYLITSTKNALPNEN